MNRSGIGLEDVYVDISPGKKDFQELIDCQMSSWTPKSGDGDYSHEIKRCLFLGRKAMMTSLDSVLKSRDITLLTKVPIVKGMVFPVVMYGRES